MRFSLSFQNDKWIRGFQRLADLWKIQESLIPTDANEPLAKI
jgi:hypothetical protein